MTILLVWILASFGAAYICGHAFITRSFREWAFKKPLLSYLVMLIECPACFGYWIGTFTGAQAFHRAGISMTWWEASLVGSFFICGTNYVLARWTELIPAAGWMQPVEPEPVPVTVQDGLNVLNAALESSRQQANVGSLGVCDAWNVYPQHHGLHRHGELCVDWRLVQQVHAQEGEQRR